MEHTNKQPRIIEGGFNVDERGKVTFYNDFDFKGVKRVYILENKSTDLIRAFHGHLKEEKYMMVLTGEAIVCAVELDNMENPNKNNTVHKFILSADKPVILHIPAGFANGSRFLKENTKMIVFSTLTLEESKADDYRFPPNYWGMNIWKG